ncbi:hypothetical protein [Mycobacterium sp. 852002-51961_SCH5331710]|uniref:hypothetical protein n=1 Tax=Mycobacterium sp. 852002-51961_SCH5331710 TaxID=1834105 RepID=UPI0007FB9D96|nr:hypothetical protein [Mycobacterium sp. 852002-51961_SCH5331710]OBB44945.1 hypothetical protein A5752_03070 [Mycobacterium sp. 852002-51961_SCH5331710]
MATQAPGRRLKKLIDSALADGCVYTEQETVSIDKAVKAEDRAAALRKLLDAELAQPEPRSRKVVELSGEIRQLDALVVKLVKELVPDPDAVSMPAKSRPHVAAAEARWARHAHRTVR